MKKVTTVFLAFIIIASFVSCAGGETIKQPTGELTDITSETKELVIDLATVKSGLKTADYGGYDFTVLIRADTSNTNIDLIAEEINGDPINDAVFERNNYLEEKYNITISAIAPNSTPAKQALTLTLAGDDAFDAVSDGLTNLATVLIAEGILIDVNELDELQLDKPWWDSNLIDNLTIKDRSYILSGDISICDDNFTMALLFNKDLRNSFGLDDIYDLIDDGKWTLDRMYEMAKQVAADLDGDGKMTLLNDRFGLLTERYGTYGLWTGAGLRITTNDNDGIPQLSMSSAHSVSVFEKAFNFHRDFDVIWLNAITGSNPYVDMVTTFGEGRAMFYYGGLKNSMDLRASDTEFGIITMPKYTEEQDNYYNTVSTWNCLAFAVPIMATDPSRTATILEAMAAVSKYTLTPAYYEITLKGKWTRDTESERMLDLIMSTRVYDLGLIFDWGGLFTMFINLTNDGDPNFASKYAALEPGAIGAMQSFIDSVK